VKHQRDAWPASRTANKRRPRSGVSFGRAGTHIAAFHGELNSRAHSLACVVHPTPKQTCGRFWSDPAAMLMLLDWRRCRSLIGLGGCCF
jgi:hypothetical protein